MFFAFFFDSCSVFNYCLTLFSRIAACFLAYTCIVFCFFVHRSLQLLLSCLLIIVWQPVPDSMSVTCIHSTILPLQVYKISMFLVLLCVPSLLCSVMCLVICFWPYCSNLLVLFFCVKLILSFFRTPLQFCLHLNSPQTHIVTKSFAN